MDRRTFLALYPAAWLPACKSIGPAGGLVAEDHEVATPDAGVTLFMRNKRPARPDPPAPGRIVLFVHGLTYPGHTCFDLPLGGESWMDTLAQRGFDTWCVDIRGYGRSTRPAAMNQPPQANAPLLDAETATSDVATAVRFVQERRGQDRLCIVGWSWGTVLAARFATMRPQSVERLVLYAPVWRWHDAPVPRPPAGAYRSVTREAARRGWLDAAPAGARDTLIPPGWFEQWADANWATDPEGAKAQPPVLRAPNGPLVEVIRRWNDGSTAFDPAQITARTLLAVGEWDRTTPSYMAHELRPLLTRAREARLVDIPQGTHQVFLERQRGVLFATVQQFLEAG